jgi:phospholipid/cholesterol/gamma-HCH transport system ATP-binding protein
MIVLDNVTVAVKDSVLLNNISFDVPDRSIVAILGKNGSGKSVILKTIAGLMNITSGSIHVDGKIPGPLMYGEFPPLVSYVFQKGGLFDSMNVFNNVAYPLQRIGVEESQITEKVRAILERVGLSGTEERLPSELSGGMQKRVCLARAVATGSSHILYDDPSAGLDPVLTDSIGAMIQEIQDHEGVTSLVVSHDLELTKKIAKFVILVHNGSLVFKGSSEAFFSCEDPYAKQFIEGSLVGPIEPL